MTPIHPIVTRTRRRAQAESGIARCPYRPAVACVWAKGGKCTSTSENQHDCPATEPRKERQ